MDLRFLSSVSRLQFFLLRRAFRIFFLKKIFTLCKTEEPLKSMELQDKKKKR